jgi:hypothetical protein
MLEYDHQRGLNYLKAYKAEHGDCVVLQHFKTEDGFTLGPWCNTQRVAYNKSQLSQERIGGLEALGFIWDPLEEKYQRGLGYLQAYKTEHGDCRVPTGSKTEDGFTLSNWCATQRNKYKKSQLSQERIDALEALGFIWDILEHDYQEGLGYLQAYKAEHGDCVVLQHFKTEDGFTLGRWCSHRRGNYKNGKLSQERIEALEALGFIWDRLEENYQIGLGYLKAYKAKHGDCVVLQHFKTEDGFTLGKWCSHRRGNYKNGKLSQERIDALEALGFIWDRLEENYQIGLGCLKAYEAEYGDCRVPRSFKTEDEFTLGVWCATQRAEYKKSKLSQERIEALEALGFAWTVQ